jgi:SAM-dependent methyltransferase
VVIKAQQMDPTNDAAGFEYPGRELEAMAQAANYHRWIIRRFAPYLGRHIVEVGAGLGSFSELILEYHQCESLALVEPSAEMYRQLLVNETLSAATATIHKYQSNFTEAAPQIRATQPPDSIMYVNVLEHIEDDEIELQSIRETLTADGRLFIFVPALTWLYGAFDERVGHFRRYTKRGLETKLQSAGFKIVMSAYFDSLGIAPWWVKYCLLRSDTMPAASVRFYDRFVVPALSRVEDFVSPPLGKNVILVAEKT